MILQENNTLCSLHSIFYKQSKKSIRMEYSTVKFQYQTIPLIGPFHRTDQGPAFLGPIKWPDLDNLTTGQAIA